MAKNTIKIKKYIDNQEEGLAAAVITPGMLLERTSTARDGNSRFTFQAHSTADGAAHVVVALEDELQGKEITEDYAAADPVQCWHVASGEQFLGLLANGENVGIGTKLVSNGDGYLKAREGVSDGEIPQSIVATALVAIDMSDSSGADPAGRIICEAF